MFIFCTEEINLGRLCTVCNATTKNAFHPHPALRVIVCENCLVSYENTVFLSHKDGTDQNCRWCAKLAERYCCSKCTALFCQVRDLFSSIILNVGSVLTALEAFGHKEVHCGTNTQLLKINL